MKAISRSVNAIRKADGGNHRNPFPHATRPGLGREKDEDRDRRIGTGKISQEFDQFTAAPDAVA